MARFPKSRKRNFRRFKKMPAKKAVVSIVRRELNRNIELKYVFRNELENELDWNGANAFYKLDSSIVQGVSDQNQRIGDKITIKSIEIGGYLRCIPTGPTIPNSIVRIIGFFWKSYDLSDPPNVSEILANVASRQLPVSSLSHDYRKNFTVFYDRVFMLNPNVTSEKNQVLFSIKKSYKAGHVVRYEGGTAWANGSPYLMAVTNFDTVSNDNPALTFTSRVRYTDA